MNTRKALYNTLIVDYFKQIYVFLFSPKYKHALSENLQSLGKKLTRQPTYTI